MRVLRCLAAVPLLFALVSCDNINNWLGNEKPDTTVANEIKMPAGTLVYRRQAEFHKFARDHEYNAPFPPNSIVAKWTSQQGSQSIHRESRCQIGNDLNDGTWNDAEQTATCNVEIWLPTNKVITLYAWDSARKRENIPDGLHLTGEGVSYVGVPLANLKHPTAQDQQPSRTWVEFEIDDNGNLEAN